MRGNSHGFAAQPPGAVKRSERGHAIFHIANFSSARHPPLESQPHHAHIFGIIMTPRIRNGPGRLARPRPPPWSLPSRPLSRAVAGPRTPAFPPSRRTLALAFLVRLPARDLGPAAGAVRYAEAALACCIRRLGLEPAAIALAGRGGLGFSREAPCIVRCNNKRNGALNPHKGYLLSCKH